MPHIHEKIDFVADVYVVYNNKVLLRKHDKYKIWLAVGGHIELNEDPVQAAIREVKEEVGLDIEIKKKSNFYPKEEDSKDLATPNFLNRHNINQNHEHISFIYFAKSDTDKIQQGEKEISDECKWFTKEELEDPSLNLKEHIAFYAKQALQELSEIESQKD